MRRTADPEKKVFRNRRVDKMCKCWNLKNRFKLLRKKQFKVERFLKKLLKIKLVLTACLFA